MGEYSKLLKKYKSVRKAAQAAGVARSTFFDRLNQENAEVTVTKALKKTKKVKVRKGSVKRYIFTSAVAGADIHEDFLRNLEAYAKYLGAELIVGPLTNATQQRYSGFRPDDYAPELIPYLRTEPMALGDKAKFCPELNLTPAAVQPLSGLQTYTKRAWAFFPHTKVAVDTVATHKGRAAKFLATTGAVTLPHYTPTKAGHKARFDHIVAAMIVEVTDKGIWFRHLHPTNLKDGTFYDLDNLVVSGDVIKHDGIAGIVYGDLHVERLDADVGAATWGFPKAAHKKTLVQLVKPETQVIHDLMDMLPINHHELDNIFARYKLWVDGKFAVRDSFLDCFKFLHHIKSQAPKNIIVDSNHDHFVTKWLLKFDPVRCEDFVNIEDYYRLKMDVLGRIRRREPFSVLEAALETMLPDELDTLEAFKFLLPDESYELHGVELSWHGHQGANGSRGSKNAFKHLTEKSTVAHFHGAFITSGTHGVGTSSAMDLGYNRGAGNWTPTHDLIYPNGTRSLITMSDKKMWADQ
jgi:hypothetical protein